MCCAHSRPFSKSTWFTTGYDLNSNFMELYNFSYFLFLLRYNRNFGTNEKTLLQNIYNCRVDGWYEL